MLPLSEWFAFTDTENVVPLGRHETYHDADEAVPAGVNAVWLFTDVTLRSLQLRIEQVLDAAKKGEA